MSLVLHWPLDALTPESRALDVSVNHYSGTVTGDPVNQPDPRFGSCLLFSGTGDTLRGPAVALTAYTLEVWAAPTAASRRFNSMLAGQDPNGIRILLDPQGGVTHGFPTQRDPLEHQAGPAGSVPDGVWTHIAATNDGKIARIFINGVQVSEQALTAPLAGKPIAMAAGLADPNVAGRPTYAGRLAHVRVYDKALTELDLKQDRAEDEAALESFVRAHPLEFGFTNIDDQPVLYIEEGAPTQSMTIRLTNTSRSDVEALPLTAVSAASHHFALLLRKGTLAPGVTPTVQGSEWAVHAEPDGSAIHLWWRTPRPITSGSSISVRLDGLNADGAEGTHGTRVELEYRKLRYVGQSDELTGSRLQFLDVVNHRGRRSLPLDFRLVNGDRVLNTGRAENNLTLHLTNLLRDGSGLALSADPKSTSTFFISFDTQEGAENRPWSLTTAGDAGLADLKTADARFKIGRNKVGQRAQWTVVPTANMVLKPGEFIEFALTRIIALTSPGSSPVIVDYANIPGYADGTATMLVERSPLMFSGANTGLGILKPAGKLHIVADNQPPGAQGALQISGPTPTGLVIGQDPAHVWAQTTGGAPLALNPTGGRIGIGTLDPHATLEIAAPVTAPGGLPTLLVGTGDTALKLGADPGGFFQQTAGADRLLGLQPASGRVSIGSLSPCTSKVTVWNPSDHLQLRRTGAMGGGGNIVYLELFQEDTAGTAVTYPSIRFHHSNKFYNRIEGRPDGIWFKFGNQQYDTLVDLHAQVGAFTQLRIGSTTIGENELQILQKLAAGQLQFDLFNIKQGEYAYAADYNPYDNDRRYVWTWRPKGRVNQGRWRIDFPS
jgi:hypothetical protein